MLRRSLLTAGIVTVLASAIPVRSARPQPGATPASLKEVKDAIIAATRYDPGAVELGVTKLQIVVTVVNSGLLNKRAIEREVEAGRITRTIARTISGKSEFQGIQAIHIDYVKLSADGRRRVVDGIDFRKDPQGNFQHHMT